LVASHWGGCCAHYRGQEHASDCQQVLDSGSACQTRTERRIQTRTAETHGPAPNGSPRAHETWCFSGSCLPG
jgi:hypothetical protein